MRRIKHNLSEASILPYPYPDTRMETSMWTKRFWDVECLYPLLAETRFQQGKLIGRMKTLDPSLQQAATIDMFTQDIVSSAALEGESLDYEDVKNIVALKLNSYHKFAQASTDRRLFTLITLHIGSGNSHDLDDLHDLHPIEAIQPVLRWAEEEDTVDSIIKAAIAHLWVITDIQKQESGSFGATSHETATVDSPHYDPGILARVVTDLLLVRSEQTKRLYSAKFYSLSTQILKEKPYYESVLERTLRNPQDISEWIEWFLYCLKSAVHASETQLETILFKHDFWTQHALQIDNDRQRQILEMLLNGYSARLTTTVWAKLTDCSQDTALRDIQDLINKEILQKLPGGGRSTAYALKDSSVGSAS